MDLLTGADLCSRLEQKQQWKCLQKPAVLKMALNRLCVPRLRGCHTLQNDVSRQKEEFDSPVVDDLTVAARHDFDTMGFMWRSLSAEGLPRLLIGGAEEAQESTGSSASKLR